LDIIRRDIHSDETMEVINQEFNNTKERVIQRDDVNLYADEIFNKVLTRKSSKYKEEARKISTK
jgi:hypothetical protein